MSESIAQKKSKPHTSTFLHEGSFGCAYTPPIPCRKAKRSKSRGRMVGKILPKSDLGPELSLSALIRSIPDYEHYYIVPEEESCDAHNFAAARETHADECSLYKRKRDSALAQLVSPYGGRALHTMKFGPDLDYMECFKHLLLAVSKLKQKGIVHFDLHMGNILCDYKGVLRIIDFGISFAIPTLTQAMINERQVNFSPGYAVEAPDLALQRAVVDGLHPERAIDMILSQKKVLRIGAAVLGISLEEQRDSLRRFLTEDRSMREHNWLAYYQTYGFSWDAWCVGMIFMYILHDLLIQPWFVSGPWMKHKGKIRTALRGLLRTNPQERMTVEDALAALST